jgi:hypothetical protein
MDLLQNNRQLRMFYLRFSKLFFNEADEEILSAEWLTKYLLPENAEILQWCMDNSLKFELRPFGDSISIEFLNDNDAVLFKVRWMG